jgi:hypothetical protein
MNKIILHLVALLFISTAFAQDLSMVSDDVIEYNTVDLRPEFPDYSGNFMDFVSRNFSLPEYDGPTGSLKVGFIIEQNGMVTNIKVLKNLDTTSTVEIKKVLAKCPKWKPAEHNGKPVRVYYEFSLKLSSAS